MGKVTKGDSQNFSGKVGNKIYSQRKNGTVVYDAPAVPKIPQRTEAQADHRLQFTNLAAVNTQFHQTLKKGFEGIGNTMSDFNAFVQCNINVVKVYIPKQVRLNGGSVLAPYQITRGKLPSIAYTKNGEGVLVSDINTGGLVIDGETSVAEFSAAIVAYNEDYQEGDQITFFYGVQTLDTVTHIPRAKISGYKIVLDLSDESPLYNYVTSQGFSSVGGCLGMDTVIEEGAAAWIHSRENASGLSVSTQYLYVDSSVLADYQTNEAFTISADSYGGINQSAVFLQPKANVGRVTAGNGAGASGTNGAGGTTGNGGSGNNGNSGSNPSGGSSGTVTVAAPTFSGETQFTESTTVSMSAESGAEIRYTLDGSTPTAESTLYSSPITLSETTTVKAIAIKNGTSSAVTERTYTKSAGNGGDNDDSGDTN